MKKLTIYRWEVAAAFVFVTLAFVAGLVVVTHYAHRTNQTARHAEEIALALRRQGAELKRERHTQFRRIQEVANESCASRHKLYLTLRDIIVQTEKDAHAEVTGPLGRVSGVQAAVNRALRNDRLFLKRLRGSDCTSVPKIVTTP